MTSLSSIRFILFLIVSILWPLKALQLENDRKLIVISMDGLMSDEVQPDVTPFITEFYKNGVHCPRLQPVFPTKTFPNHFSIATGELGWRPVFRALFSFLFFFHTGLYAGSHGVFDLGMYDHKLHKTVDYSPELYMFRPNVTPIWTLNELAGGHSAVSMWSANEFAFRGRIPTFSEPYDTNTIGDWQQRIDRLVPLLQRNESQINFVMFYIDHPDRASHGFSVPSKEVKLSILWLTGRMFDLLQVIDFFMIHVL